MSLNKAYGAKGLRPSPFSSKQVHLHVSGTQTHTTHTQTHTPHTHTHTYAPHTHTHTHVHTPTRTHAHTHTHAQLGKAKKTNEFLQSLKNEGEVVEVEAAAPKPGSSGAAAGVVALFGAARTLYVPLPSPACPTPPLRKEPPPRPLHRLPCLPHVNSAPTQPPPYDARARRARPPQRPHHPGH